MIVSCFKSSLVYEMCTEEEIQQFSYMQHYKPVSQVHMSMYAYDFTFLPTFANCYVAVCPCLVRVKHPVSIIPILLYFLQVP